MSGIDLWDDDLSADSATVEVPPLHIHLIAASEHEEFWRLGLESHGVRLGDAADPECQLILVDERCPHYEQRLLSLPLSEGARRPPIFFLVTNGANDRQISPKYADDLYDQLVNSLRREKVIFTPREGGVEHVGADNMAYGRDLIADWFAKTLGGHTA